tara:strand:+ start:1474 stop:1650 length:177 start_codon:yes stop_codon:yes gene_type:complete
MIIDTDPTFYSYQLIDYGKPYSEWKPIKIAKLTSGEAHQLNYALALNGTTKRYIKNDN